jgi:hypothetical protein
LDGGGDTGAAADDDDDDSNDVPQVIFQLRGQGLYPPTSLVDRLARACVEGKRWDVSLKLVRREGVPVEPETYSLAIKVRITIIIITTTTIILIIIIVV